MFQLHTSHACLVTLGKFDAGSDAPGRGVTVLACRYSHCPDYCNLLWATQSTGTERPRLCAYMQIALWVVVLTVQVNWYVCLFNMLWKMQTLRFNLTPGQTSALKRLFPVDQGHSFSCALARVSVISGYRHKPNRFGQLSPGFPRRYGLVAVGETGQSQGQPSMSGINPC